MFEELLRRITIEKVEVDGGTIRIEYREVPDTLARELTVVLEGAEPGRLSEETLKKIVLLAELMSDLAEDIELDNDPSEHGNIHPDGWAAVRYTDEMGGNTIVIRHRVYESNE